MHTITPADVVSLRDMLMESEEQPVATEIDQRPTPSSSSIRVSISPFAFNPSLAPSRPENEIWAANELLTFRLRDYESPDRTTPEFTTAALQTLEVLDVARGLRDGPTADTPYLVLRVKLPGASFDEVWLEADEQSLWVQSFDHSLRYHVPFPFDKRQVTSKWASAAAELCVTIPKLATSR